MEIDHREIGRQATAERKKHGISLRKVAGEMGISPPYLSDLERGRRNWNENIVNKFNIALGLLIP